MYDWPSFIRTIQAIARAGRNGFRRMIFGLLTLKLCIMANGESACLTAQPVSRSPKLQDSIVAARTDFLKTLQDVATDSRQQGLQRELAATESMSDFVENRDPDRQYIFLPDSPWESFAGNGFTPDPTWLERAKTARETHAERLFEIAKDNATSGPGAPIFQLMHEVLYWNPDHEAARVVLGHRGEPGEWEVTSEKLRVRQSTRAHPVMNWPAGQWIEVTTEHFTISSIADEEATRQLAGQAERWRWVWQQVFFDFWNSAERLARTLEGLTPKRNTRRFAIILFPDRESYVAQLQDRVPGIAQSTGYYSDQQKTSFFYVGSGESIADTWRHELTHQFFQESVKAKPGVFDDGYLWLGEGIAMYMESLQDFGSHVTLGGFDAARLQYSRIRKIREGYYVPLAEITPVPLARFQVRTDLRNLYSQSAGVTQMLMTADNGLYRDGLVSFLGLLYAGRVKDDAFARLVGVDFGQIDRQYGDFLAVDPEQVRKFLLRPLTVTELALPNVQLDDAAFAAIGRCSSLIWLDLSGGEVTREKMDQLANCDQLKQLFLSRTTIRGKALTGLGQFERLEELDLSGSNISDATLSELPVLNGLTSLSLVNTPVTNSVLPVILRLPALQSIALQGSQITPAGIRQLQTAKPDVTIR